MMYWVLAGVLSFAVFAGVTAGLSAVAGALVPVVLARTGGLAPAVRARALFWLRLSPALGGSVAAFVIVLPVFLALEPRDTREMPGVILLALAAAGAASAGGVLRRALAACLATRRLQRALCDDGEPFADAAARMPAVAVDAPFPVVAVIGCWRPRLIVARRVLAECPERELRAMIAHERAHVSAHDNLRRLLMTICPRLVSRRAQQRLEIAWTDATEAAADERASHTGEGRALDLADALVRLARIGLRDTALPASAFYTGGSVEPRVRRLLAPPAEGGALPRPIHRLLLASVLGSTAVAAS
ncbi:MAG TPA: M48 family metalloprotease, partial [Vicinamibacterales bacterium]|nr:M48 family metalloprotease [Vicinamibacterales bacterium]